MPPLTIERAMRLCTDRGLRLTTQRQRVLAYMLAANKPLKAYDIVDGLGDVKPMTVYRALDFLTQAGLARRIESRNTYIPVAASNDSGPVPLLICDECGHVEQINSNAIERSLDKICHEIGFHAAPDSIEIHGHCSDCALSAIRRSDPQY